MKTFALAAVVLAVGVGSVTAATAARGEPFVLNGDLWIGTYHVWADNTLYGAIKAWGEPTSKRVLIRRFGVRDCEVSWSELGVRAVFWGDPDACAPQYGCIRVAFITGKQWRTTKGLRIGDPRRYVFYRYGTGPYTTLGRDGEWY